MRQPVIVDVVGVFSDSQPFELLNRHSRYGQRVKSATNGQVDHLLVLSRSQLPVGSLVDERDGLRVSSLGPSPNPWILGKIAAKLLRSHQLPVTWIAGSPFRESIACRSANKALKGRLQIQVHGNFDTPNFRTGILKSHLRRAISRINLHHADSIRIVSASQATSLQRTFAIDPSRLVLAPVPINAAITSRETGRAVQPTANSIGFVGRLHRERGLVEWVQVARQLWERDRSSTFEIIGDGPHHDEFRAALTRFVPSQNIHFHGRLSGVTLVKKLQTLSVVVNTCQAEAFGRSTLECLLLGVPVISVRSPGTSYLKTVFNPPHLFGVSLSEVPLTALKVLGEAPMPDLEQLARDVARFEDKNIQLLVESWI